MNHAATTVLLDPAEGRDGPVPVDAAAVANAHAALGPLMQARGVHAGHAVLLAVAHPRTQALLAGALPRGWPLAPAETTLLPAAATRILARIAPGLLVTDQPDSPLAAAAHAAGIPLACVEGEPWRWHATPGDRPPEQARRYPEDLALLLETTGTSGEPKLVGLSRANLAASVAGIAGTLGLGPADRTVTVMPLSHVHGLVAVLHGSLAAGGQVVPIPSRDPEAFWRTLDQTRPTWLSMVPTLLQAVLDAAPTRKPASLDGLRLVRTSSSGLPGPLRRRAEAWFGVPVLEAYGMTEACHQMASQRPGATPSGSVGPAGPGVEVSIRTADGAALADGAVGEVCVRGPNVMRGYLHPPEANAGAFHPGGWLRTGDLGRLDAEGSLWLSGRLKEQINRGGETLSPAEIEAALLAHPGVAEAVAFPLPHPSLGEEVAAVVVPRRGGAEPPGTAEILDAAVARLPFAQVPKTLFLADALPRLPSGKISRIAIAARFRDAQAATGTAPATAADEASRARLRGLLTAVLGLDAVGDGDSFFALGGTSLHAVQLMARIEAETGVALPVSRLLTHPTAAALAGLVADAPPVRTKAPRPAEGPFPASAHIVALCVAERLDPQPGQNSQPLLLRLAEGIGPDAAEAAWDAVLAAQPMLCHRLRSDAEDGTLDLAPLDAADRPRLQRLAVSATAEAIAADPLAIPAIAAFLEAPAPALARAAWIGGADGTAFLLVAAHAAVADGYGKALLPRLIDAALRGRPLPAASADLPAICGAAPAAPPAPPTAAAEGLLHEDGPQDRDRRARTLERPLGAARWAAVQAWARQAGVTPFAAMLALYGHLLGRLAGAPVPVWVPRQRRRGAADYATIANATALVRWRLAGDDAPADLPAAARAAMAALFAAAEAGEDAHPDRDARACLLEIADEAREIEALHPDLSLGGAVRAATALPERHAEVDIKLLLVPPGPDGTADGAARLVFAPARFSEARAAALLDAFLDLADRALAAPAGTPLADLPLARAHDRPRAWTAPAAAPGVLGDPAIADLGALSERILARFADAAAIVWPGGGRATFAEVDALARALERALAAQGQPLRGRLVGFRIAAEGHAGDRVLFLAAQVACWRLGAALLPLGHQTPPAQARAMAETLGIAHLIDARGTLDAAPAWAATAPPRQVEGHPDARVVSDDAPGSEPPALPQGTAMVFATSGTTGMPKAIAESHGTILALLRGLAGLPGMPAAPGLMGTNIGFDPVLSDVWIPWSHGQPVVVLPTERRTPAALAEARGLGARILGLSPTVAAAAQREDPGCLDGFEALLLTGEALPVPLAEALAERAPRLAAFNLYGPTETTVWASAWRVEPWTERTVPVGDALPGYRILIVDPATGRPLPPGWPGEVTIATPVASPGYLDRALTADRFVAVEGEAGGPFFRTGDHGWVDAEGRLRFVGRTDRQVQVRGVRIELDGIERVLGRVPGVAEAAALVLGEAGPAPRLVAAVAAARTADPAALPEAALAACRAWLPRAAVPADIVVLEAMPRGPSGKTSHAALRTILEARAAAARPAPGGRRPAPGSVGARIAALWAALLAAGGRAVPPIGLDDELFALGATSLDALMLAERMEGAFGIAVPSEQLFLHPTLAGQAAVVSAALRAAQRPPDARRPAAGLSRGPVRFHQARGPREGHAERGIVLTLPGIHGKSPFLGNLAAGTLAEYRIVAASVVVEGRSLLEGHQWLDVVRAVVQAIDAGEVPTPAALLGFSMCGWLAWIVERMRRAAGAAPLPVISLDGSAMHARRRDLAERLATVLPAPEPPGPSRLLLIHCAAQGRFRVGRDRHAAWRQVGVEPACIPIRSVRHFDAVSRETMAAANAAMARFILDPTGLPADAAPIEAKGPGSALCRLLEAPHPPEAARMRALLAEGIEAEALDDVAWTTLLFLAMASGDRVLALNLARRKAAEDPANREAAFAEVAILAEGGEAAAAAARAEAWRARGRRDAAMLARARERAGPVADPVSQWADAPPMAVNSDAALDFAARFCAR